MSLRRLPMTADLINRNFDDYSLLDIGCRTMDLKPMLKGCREYYGTDFIASAGVYECNLEEGLPQFSDGAFDIVTALDVLEHLENAHKTLQEAFRVAKRAVFVSLPNMYYISFRWSYFAKGRLSGKYDFPVEPIMDRHRWVLSFTEAVNFIQYNCKDSEIEVLKITPQRGRTRVVAEPVEKWLADKCPDAFAYGSLFMICKKA